MRMLTRRLPWIALAVVLHVAVLGADWLDWKLGGVAAVRAVVLAVDGWDSSVRYATGDIGVIPGQHVVGQGLVVVVEKSFVGRTRLSPESRVWSPKMRRRR